MSSHVDDGPVIVGHNGQWSSDHHHHSVGRSCDDDYPAASGLDVCVHCWSGGDVGLSAMDRDLRMNLGDVKYPSMQLCFGVLQQDCRSHPFLINA